MPAFAPSLSGRGVLLSRQVMTVASPSEITGLTIALANTDLQIDKALDERNQRAFRLWCQRRTSLLVKLERTLLAVATAKTPA